MVGCYEIPGWLLTVGLFGLVIWLIADAIRIIIYLIEKFMKQESKQDPDKI